MTESEPKVRPRRKPPKELFEARREKLPAIKQDTKPPADGETLPNTLQQNLIALLFRFQEGKIVADNVNANLFEGEYRDCAERAIKHWRKYGKPPGDAHSADLFNDIWKDPHDRRKKTYQRLLVSIAEVAPNLDVKFIQDQLKLFTETQRLKDTVLKAAELLNQGGSDAREQISELVRSLETTSSAKSILTTRSLDQFEYRDVEWLWWPFFPKREITTLYGDGAIGKSSILLDVTVRIAGGKPWPQFDDEPIRHAPKGSVLLLTKEDDPETVLRPRCEAAGATEEELSRIHFVGFDDPEDASQFDSVDRLDINIPQLEQKIKELGDVRLLGVDPITDFAGKTDSWRDESIRALLTPLTRLARRYNFAIIIILHLNKKTEGNARSRALGGVGWINVPRSAVLVGKDPDDEATRIMVQEKENLTHNKLGAAFRTKTVRAVHKIVWEQERPIQTAEELMHPGKQQSKLERATHLIEKNLADGAKRKAFILNLATDAGISKRTLHQAKADLSVESFRKEGLWYWRFPKDAKRAGFVFKDAK